jgi:peptide/nickel transport system substrate-binding protein
MAAMSAGQSSDYGALGYNTSKSAQNGNAQKDTTYDDMYTALTQEFDVAKRNQKVKELETYYFENAYCINFPFDYVSTYWYPWLKNYHGEQAIGQFYVIGPVWAHVWVDQDLKMKMIGK